MACCVLNTQVEDVATSRALNGNQAWIYLHAIAHKNSSRTKVRVQTRRKAVNSYLVALVALMLPARARLHYSLVI